MPDKAIRILLNLLLLVTVFCLPSCGQRKVMQQRLQAATVKHDQLAKELSAVQEQFVAKKKNLAEGEEVLFSQAMEPEDSANSKKKVSETKPSTIEEAADRLRYKMGVLNRQKEKLEEDYKQIQADSTAYHDQYYQAK